MKEPSRFFIFPDFLPLFPDFWQFFLLSRGALCPLPSAPLDSSVATPRGAKEGQETYFGVSLQFLS